jgi:tRNA1(Val) A37 N6-methylase TrmN6
MEILHNGFTLETPAGTFPLSTDSILLADFVRLPRNANVLDLGAGCGTLGILLCAGDPSCRVTGIEYEETAHLAAQENIRRNGLCDRMESIFADLRRLPDTVKAGSFSCCVSNPPYYSGGAQSRTVPHARHTETCEAEDLFSAAAYALKYGGDFFLVHKPEMLAQLCAHAVKNGLEPKRLCLVRHSPGKDISTVLLQCRKGGKPGLKLEEYCLYDENRQPTPAYRRIYHLGD